MLSTLLRRKFGTFSTRTLKGHVVEKLGIKNKTILRNLSYAELYELALSDSVAADPDTRNTVISSTGAICAYSGKRTGRSPTDKRIVLDHLTKDEIWWGDINVPIEQDTYKFLEEIAINYLNNQEQIYVIDGYGGWDPAYRLKFRIFCTRAYHALFMKNMLIKPSEEELKKDFAGGADYYIFNSGEYLCPTSNLLKGVSQTSKCCVSLNLSQRKMVILGTQYAGEMKKGIFSIMHYLMPKQGILSLHASANVGSDGDVTLLFGLSGTGKTTLSSDPGRFLIGDDEHCWSDNGIFNIEGGCYAKCIGLTEEREPEIYRAIRFGAVLENVLFHSDKEKDVNFNDVSITQNTRVSYPLEYIPGARIPAVAGHPKNIIFLTCDSFGILPPVSKITPEQAMYHFMSGYTAKVAGTEMGIEEPVATFSACFGAAFLPLHPNKYAKMLAEKMKKHGSNAWLVNSGWSGGEYGEGKRMDLSYTRRIIDAIHNGELENGEFENFPIFNVQIPKTCSNVPTEILNPRNTWKDKSAFDKGLKNLAQRFINNFEEYKDEASIEVINAGPKIN